MIPEFFRVDPSWDEQIERIVAAVERVAAIEGTAADTPTLRRATRVGAVHSSVVIEGNRLSPVEAVAVANGDVVLAPQRDVEELRNALAAYELVDRLDPWSVGDLLEAHRVLTTGLVAEAGAFRTVDVEIVNPFGDVIHTGSRHAKVPRLVAELLEWGRACEHHPLVVSGAVHFLIEHIHPFRDGNGRIGRLWQTLILTRWEPLFAWTPTETLIAAHQSGYYEALQASRDPDIDAAPFISFMLGVIGDALRGYEDAATRHVGINVGTHGAAERDPAEVVLRLITADPHITAAGLAARMGLTARHVERLIKRLRDEGRLVRVGSRKAGQWRTVTSRDASWRG
ncbi:MAG: Fic family protein [Bifidobacteriaceae bacterium]|jgi:Fic family protein|nr:Fic family protein [Bifidobacteriaceae bacterium]